ncbi:hypothetical protein BASA81_005815 [Batrachochytrium salamandrivorans]|nr:hypothetical protein BASA81_005815 [Batrachochytrium salamandrivorans]
MSTKKQVVIVGGGYSGCYTARALDRANSKQTFEITIISPRDDFMLHKIGSLRAAVNGDEAWHNRVLVPTTSVFNKNRSGRFVQGLVVSVQEDAKTVTLQDGQVFKWDVLFVASGSISTSPAENLLIHTRQEQKQYFADFHRVLTQSKSVLIVGAGPVGIELAGEIAATFGDKIQIQIVSKGEEILQTSPPLLPKGVQSVSALLEKEHVAVLLGDELAQSLKAGEHWAATPGGIELKSGKKVDCDLVVLAAGVKVSTSFLPPSWLDAVTGEVEIDLQTFVLTKRKDVFAAGDAAKTNFTKLGYVAMGDAPVVAKNILAVLKGKEPTNKVKRAKTGMMIIPFGPSKGRILTPVMTLGNFAASVAKSKDLFTALPWTGLDAAKVPKPLNHGRTTAPPQHVQNPLTTL